MLSVFSVLIVGTFSVKTFWKAIYTLRHKGDNQRKRVRKINLPCKSLNYLSGRWDKAPYTLHSQRRAQ